MESISHETVKEYLKERGWTNSEREIPYREVVMLLGEFAGQQVKLCNKPAVISSVCECNEPEQMGEFPVMKCAKCGKLSIDQTDL